MGIFLIIFGLLLMAGCLTFFYFKFVKFVKDKNRNSFEKKEKIIIFSLMGIFALAGLFLQLGINLQTEWKLTPLEVTLSLLGGFFTSLSIIALVYSFSIYYWKPNMVKEERKWWRIAMFISIPSLIIFFLFLGEGVANHLSYPLTSGINLFSHHGIDFTNAGMSSSEISDLGGLHIAFYGIFIVGGALIVYAICDHKFYQSFGKHGLLEGVFLVGFLSGIIGARVGYVIGNWNKEFAEEVNSGNWFAIFDIRSGGLTILGGAIAGIIFGSLFALWRRKESGLRYAMDICVPTILIAQAIGRWGNFFNKEVYGASIDNLNFLPTWIVNQMAAEPGKMYVPLYLLEGMLNLAGYFIIVYLVGKLLKKWLHRGDLAFSYLIWYGTIRLILEPFRDANYNMGDDGKWSIIWAAIYIGLGVLAIIGNHLFDYFYVKSGHKLFEPKWNPPHIEEKVVEVKIEKENKDEEGEDIPLPNE